MTKLDLTYASKGLDPKVIAVHDGRFHVDDVFAAMLMRSIYPNAKIIRTRDDAKLNLADIVIDVGYIHDEKSLRFDHHQEGKAGKRINGIEFSGFGLVWKYWGLEICVGDQDLYNEIDKALIQPIDADDNGQSLYSKSEPNFDEEIQELTIGRIIGYLNNPNTSSLEDFDTHFDNALGLAEIVFEAILNNKKSFIEGKKEIVKSYQNVEDKRFVVDEFYRPVLRYSEHLPELLFYVFPRDDSGEEGHWLMKCAGSSTDNVNRKNLPKEWAGKSGQDLETTSGIEGMLFCHNNLFICGAKSKEAILKALEFALQY